MKNSTEAIIDAVLSGLYATIDDCKAHKFAKQRICASENLSKSYIVEEPFESKPKNLFVPFTNPYADKFQG